MLVIEASVSRFTASPNRDWALAAFLQILNNMHPVAQELIVTVAGELVTRDEALAAAPPLTNTPPRFPLNLFKLKPLPGSDEEPRRRAGA